MAKIFEITNNIKKIAADAIEDLYSQLAKGVRLYYPPQNVPCSNCAGGFGNKPDSSFTHGAPTNLTNINCSFCGGVGYKSVAQTEEINLKLNFNLKSFKDQIPQNVQVPDGILQAKGFIEDIPKILKAEYMVAQTTFEPYIQQTYKLWIPPTDTSNIAQNRFFVSYWKRI